MPENSDEVTSEEFRSENVSSDIKIPWKGKTELRLHESF